MSLALVLMEIISGQNNLDYTHTGGTGKFLCAQHGQQGVTYFACTIHIGTRKLLCAQQGVTFLHVDTNGIYMRLLEHLITAEDIFACIALSGRICSKELGS